jgi:hypothetical protein
MPPPSGRCTRPGRLRRRPDRFASPPPRSTTPRATFGVRNLVATQRGLKVGTLDRHLWLRLYLLELRLYLLEQTCTESRLMYVLRRPRPVRESYDSDSPNSRLSREGATRNLSLGLLSNSVALKPLLSDQGRGHLATTERPGHVRLIEGYLREAVTFENTRGLDRSSRRMFGDPLYAFVGESTGPPARE